MGRTTGHGWLGCILGRAPGRRWGTGLLLHFLAQWPERKHRLQVTLLWQILALCLGLRQWNQRPRIQSGRGEAA